MHWNSNIKSQKNADPIYIVRKAWNRTHRSFATSATRTQLLSSGEFYKLRYDTIPVKSESANVSFYTSNSKMPNFELWHSCRRWAICMLWFTVLWDVTSRSLIAGGHRLWGTYCPRLLQDGEFLQSEVRSSRFHRSSDSSARDYKV